MRTTNTFTILVGAAVALAACSHSQDYKDMQKFLETHSPNAAVAPDITTLCYSIWSNKSKDAIELLVDKGADVNAASVAKKDGTSLIITPLMMSAFRDNLPVAKYLLKHGANVNAEDAKGRNAFQYVLTKDKAPWDNLLRKKYHQGMSTWEKQQQVRQEAATASPATPRGKNFRFAADCSYTYDHGNISRGTDFTSETLVWKWSGNTHVDGTKGGTSWDYTEYEYKKTGERTATITITCRCGSTGGLGGLYSVRLYTLNFTGEGCGTCTLEVGGRYGSIGADKIEAEGTFTLR